MRIRPAEAADASAVAAIYDYYVQHTAITFAAKAPSAAAFAAKIADERYPFLIAEDAGQVSGFIYAASFREKEAFRWDVELTIYLLPGRVGCGTGRMLMEACLRILSAQGYLNAYSCITLPNERSIGLHKHLGFVELGVFPRTGYKLGRWHDVIWLGKTLGQQNGIPAEIRLVTDVFAQQGKV
ncbi:MAG: N-acetyltransferase [Clostridia bacterium]|nr:N-acetyltransferase [Clostridia bacterium]